MHQISAAINNFQNTSSVEFIDGTFFMMHKEKLDSKTFNMNAPYNDLLEMYEDTIHEYEVAIDHHLPPRPIAVLQHNILFLESLIGA